MSQEGTNRKWVQETADAESSVGSSMALSKERSIVTWNTVGNKDNVTR